MIYHLFSNTPQQSNLFFETYELDPWSCTYVGMYPLVSSSISPRGHRQADSTPRLEVGLQLQIRTPRYVLLSVGSTFLVKVLTL